MPGIKTTFIVFFGLADWQLHTVKTAIMAKKVIMFLILLILLLIFTLTV